MPGRGNPFVQARLPQELYDALRAKAGSDLSEAIRRAIAEYVGTASGGASPRLIRSSRKATRLERLERLRDSVRALLDEYENWQSSLPENLSGSATGERLAETVEQLEQVVELLDAVEAPRGFGRD